MAVHLECLSHTPLRGSCDPAPEIVAEVARIEAAARARVEAFDPELVIVFAPDHYNGFFYDLMPPFCIGAAASGVGDYGSSAGPLPVPAELALACTRQVLASDIDVALSYRMQVDHGCVQALEVLTGGIDRYPTLPVFINSVAPPMPPCRRVRRLGEAIGLWAAQLGQRVLIVGSGGISHEPPVPEIATADAEVAERLINGRNPSADARAARQARTIAAAQGFAAGARADMHALNPAWDRDFLATLARGDLAALDAWRDDDITREAGRSAHEIRNWIAAFAALAASGPYEANIEYYRAINEWIAGFAVMQASPRPA